MEQRSDQLTVVLQTWNRPDRLEFSNAFADHMLSSYRLLMESDLKAQAVQRDRFETIMDAVQK